MVIVGILILAWTLVSFVFMLVYKPYGDESIIERILIIIACLPWFLVYLIYELIEKRKYERKNR